MGFFDGLSVEHIRGQRGGWRHVAYHRVTLLQQFVHNNQCLKRLDFIGKNGLSTESVPDGKRGVVIPRVDDTFCETI